MVATTMEAIASAGYLDAGETGLSAVHTMMQNLGLLTHSLHAIPNKQTITNMPSPSSLARGLGGTSRGRRWGG
jgi:hypothetical protein